MHKPIQIKDLSLYFPHKTCFEKFTVQINYGDRIAIIGRNGSGKSTLIKILQGLSEPKDGHIGIPNDFIFGYVPQIIDFGSLSGGERLNKAITQALSSNPNALCLDEPTNHLDQRNRKNLIKMLNAYMGTLIIASHDKQLLRECINTLWHIDNERVYIFSGRYDDYIREIQIKRSSIKEELSNLDRQKMDIHRSLMKEQQRVSKSRTEGKKKIANNRWMKSIGDLKAMKAEKSQGNKLKTISQKKCSLTEQLSNLRLPEIIVPKFSINACDIGEHTLLSISEGAVGYNDCKPLITDINITVRSKNRIAITGDNGSGKSTFIKAIINDPSVEKSGIWQIPNKADIGYLDQHYSTLSPKKSVTESIAGHVSDWSYIDIRRHLNDFLFRKNEEVNSLVCQLSGGEKARLSLAQIAAKTPKLLLLDEITNNLDIENIEHITEVLATYPGAFIAISHDEDFLKEIGIKDFYIIENTTIRHQCL